MDILIITALIIIIREDSTKIEEDKQKYEQFSLKK